MSPSQRKKLPESLTHAEEIEREEATDSNSGSESEPGESDSETDEAPRPPPASASAPPPPVVASTSSCSESGSESDESASSSEDKATPPASASAPPPPVVASTASGSVSDESASSSEDKATPPASASAPPPPVVASTASGSESDESASSSEDKATPPASASAPPPPVVASTASGSESDESASSSEDKATPPASASAPPPPVVASTASGSESDESASSSEDKATPPASASAPPPPVVASTASGSESDESASSSEDEASPLPPASASASASVLPPPVVASTASGSETHESASSSKDGSETPPPTGSVSAPPVASGASASGSESETESELPLQPLALVASQKSLRKRPSEGKLVLATKRTRTEVTDTTAKKASFERVWHPEDEINLLQGILDFKNKYGKVPSHNYHAVYEMTKGSTYLEGKIYSQYSSKITALKTKYLKKNHTFTSDHELLCLALCKHIWIDDLVRVDSDIDWFETSDLVEDLRRSVGEVVVKERWSLVSVERKKSLKEKWKALQARGFERFMLRSELVLEITSAISKVDNDNVTVDGESESDWLESKLVGDLTRSGLVDEDTVKDKWSLVSIVMKRKLSDKWKVLVEHDVEQLRLRSELVYEISSALYDAK